jgi:hypothetical protein
MQIINDSFHGFRQFAAGILSHGDKLGEWVACRDLQATRVNLSVVIGGTDIKVADGADLLRELVTAAKAGKLSEDEAVVIAGQLDLISPRFDHRKCMYFCEVILQDVPLTDSQDSATIEDKGADVVLDEQAVEAPKRGRKAVVK